MHIDLSKSASSKNSAPFSRDGFTDADVPMTITAADGFTDATVPTSYTPSSSGNIPSVSPMPSMSNAAFPMGYSADPTAPVCAPMPTTVAEAEMMVSQMSEEQMNAALSQYSQAARTANIVLIAGIATFILGGFITPLLSALGFIAGVVGIVMSISCKKKYGVDAINERIVEECIASAFENGKVSRHIAPAKRDFIDSSLSHFYNKKTRGYYNNFYANDLIWGTHREHPFEICDVKAEYEWTDSDGDTHTETRFCGQYLRFPTDKTMKHDLYIRRKGTFEWKRENDGGILTDSSEFNKKWHVMSSSPQDALYVLTPHFMERLEEFENIISNSLGIQEKTDYIFCEDGSFIAFIYSQRNLFELDGVKSKDQTVETLRERYAQETEWVRTLMEHLHFDQR